LFQQWKLSKFASQICNYRFLKRDSISPDRDVCIIVTLCVPHAFVGFKYMSSSSIEFLMTVYQINHNKLISTKIRTGKNNFFFLNFLQSLNFMNELLHHLHSFRTFGHLWCKRRCRTHFMMAVLINHWTWMWFSNFYIILSEHKMVRLHSSAKPALIALRSCIVHVTQFIFMEYHDQSQKIIKEIHYITKLILILMSFYRDLHVHVIVDSKEI
jgi:hypothetical protein